HPGRPAPEGVRAVGVPGRDAAQAGRPGPGGRGVRLGLRRGADQRPAPVGPRPEPAPGGPAGGVAAAAAPARRRRVAAPLPGPPAPGPLAARQPLSSTVAVILWLGAGRGGCPRGEGACERGEMFPRLAAFDGGRLAPPTTPAPAPTAATSGTTAAVSERPRYGRGLRKPIPATASGALP